jgi:8-oxo-dGTP diphosphatase
MADIRKVGLLFVKDGRVLLCRSRKHPERLILPGGKREPGETSLETLQRELREELGEVELREPVYLGSYVAPAVASKNATSQKTVEIELYGGRLSGALTPSSEIEELVWFGPEDCWEWLAPSLSGLVFPDLCRRELLPWKTPGAAQSK